MIENKIKAYSLEFEEKIDRFLPKVKDDYKIVYDAMMYSLKLGGKRLRPFLVNEFYKLCGGVGDLTAPVSVAIESIHTYSLIHDDLPCMDNDDIRRGKPSCHVKFGEEYALLAGDGLLTEAFGIIADAKDIKPEAKVKVISALAHYSGINGMIGGQTVDLLSENTSASEEKLILICNLKTAALIKAAAVMGCILAGADEEKIIAAKKYADNLGLAFQIMDDILDEIGESEKLGKPIHSDKENMKSTFVSVYGIENCKNRVEELTNEAKKALDLFGEKADTLKALADYLCKREY